MKVKLLDFFRSASFGGVRIGFHRNRIESILGKPDFSVPGHSTSDDYRQAGLWYYAGVQFTFVDLDAGLLSEIGFKPFYLYPSSQYRDLETEKTKLDLWVFDQAEEPTIEKLRLALENEDIPFKDTGLETCVYNEEKKKFELILYAPTLEDVESFGTLVLQGGVQIRYSDDKSIIRVASGADWMVKGREQDINWSDQTEGGGYNPRCT